VGVSFQRSRRMYPVNAFMMLIPKRPNPWSGAGSEALDLAASRRGSSGSDRIWRG